LGVLLTSSYFISSDYASPVAVADVIDQLLDDPRFVEAVADDALLLEYGPAELDERIKAMMGDEDMVDENGKPLPVVKGRKK
jgi:hypothetical protein